ncbi:TrbC/VirB2 family protein [Qipengyuania sp. ASV99]|uniref:TrbC/VirB2 family protein n=1 Tax=Qipengyuania sp. ASV99 TaxID=3399681 RepID=UPI003A4C7AD3
MTSLFRNLAANPVTVAARFAALLAVFLMPATAYAQNQPQGSGPITNAVVWMQSILLGPIATSLAVMAVAAVGFMMLTGRMNWRFGATVIIGVFIIFGAPVIVAGIAGTA